MIVLIKVVLSREFSVAIDSVRLIARLKACSDLGYSGISMGFLGVYCTAFAQIPIPTSSVLYSNDQNTEDRLC